MHPCTRFVSIALRVLLLATASLLVLSSCTPDMPPSWVRWNVRVFTCDVCGMQAQARVSVADGTARATTADNHVLDMPREWRVQDGMATDVDGDGTDELILLCWRKSFYGTSQPFWYDGSWDDEWSQHLFSCTVSCPTTTGGACWRACG